MADRPQKSNTDNRVTHEQLDFMIDTADTQYWQPYDNTLVGIYRFKNGWTIVENASCVDPANYEELIAIQIIRDKVKDQLWKLEGYKLCTEFNEKSE